MTVHLQISVCSEKNKPFSDWMITSDEKSIMYENIVRKWVYCKPRQLSSSTSKLNLSLNKRMLHMYIVGHYEHLKSKNGSNSEMYCQQMDDLNDALKRKRRALVNRKQLVLHHDNTRPYTTLWPSDYLLFLPAKFFDWKKN